MLLHLVTILDPALPVAFLLDVIQSAYFSEFCCFPICKGFVFNNFYRYAELRSVHGNFDVCVSGSSTAQTGLTQRAKEEYIRSKKKGLRRVPEGTT